MSGECLQGVVGTMDTPSGQASGLKSAGKAGGRHCAQRIYHKVRMDETHWRRKASGRCMNKER